MRAVRGGDFSGYDRRGGYYKLVPSLSNESDKILATGKVQWERVRRGNAALRESTLLSPFLHVILDEFFRVFFEYVVDFIDQLVDVFFEFLAGLDDLRVGFDFFFALRFSSDFLLAFLFFHRIPPKMESWIRPEPRITILSEVRPGKLRSRTGAIP